MNERGKWRSTYCSVEP